MPQFTIQVVSFQFAPSYEFSHLILRAFSSCDVQYGLNIEFKALIAISENKRPQMFENTGLKYQNVLSI